MTVDIMGGICSRRSTEDHPSVGGFPNVNGRFSYGSGMVYQSCGMPVQENTNMDPSPVSESTDNQSRDPFAFPDVHAIHFGMNGDDIDDGIPRLSRALSNRSRTTMSKQIAVAKVCTLGLF